jgi:hypothetical protein
LRVDDVPLDLDPAVLQEQVEAQSYGRPAREGVSDRLGELGLLADQPELFALPCSERLDDRRMRSWRTPSGSIE